MKKIFTVISTILLLSCIAASTFAQNKKMNMAEFEKRKMEYIKSTAGLTDKEASLYLPLYNELSKKKFELFRVHREKIKKMKKGDQEMSEQEYKKLLDNDMELRLKEAELEKEYSDKFKKVLSPEKIYKAQQAEKNFIQKEVSKFRSGNKN